MKRLFITTGLISLVNVLAIIDETQEEDDLIIISFNQNKNFVDTSTQIAKLHNFKNIKFFKKEKELIKEVSFQTYDQIYCATLTRLYPYLKKHPNWNLFEEGPGYAITDLSKCKNLKSCFIANYLNKFDIIDKENKVKHISINKEKFLKISSEILNFMQTPKKLTTQRNVLFIGHYIYRKLGDEFALDFYKKYINYFINLGYNVYLKAHPRDKDYILPKLEQEFSNNKFFHILNTSMPIEIYDYNFDAVIGAYSGTLVSLPHYRNIPAINLQLKELYSTDIGLNYKKFFAIYDEYTPSFDEMENILQDPKTKIWQEYKKIITSKISLKDNLDLNKIILYKPNLINDIFCHFISYLCSSKTFKQKLSNYARKDFEKMIDRYK